MFFCRSASCSGESLLWDLPMVGCSGEDWLCGWFGYKEERVRLCRHHCWRGERLPWNILANLSAGGRGRFTRASRNPEKNTKLEFILNLIGRLCFICRIYDIICQNNRFWISWLSTRFKTWGRRRTKSVWDSCSIVTAGGHIKDSNRSCQSVTDLHYFLSS